MFEVKIILIVFFLLSITILGISAQPPADLKSNLEKLRKDFASIIGPVDDNRISELVQCADPSTGKCNAEQRNGLVRGVSVWLKYLNHDAPCDPETNEFKFTSTFYVINGIGIIRDKSKLEQAYIDWLQILVESGHSFCNPLNHLTCDPNSKKCVCRESGLRWGGDLQIGPTPGACLLPLGGDCTSFPTTFDPNSLHVARLNRFRNFFSGNSIFMAPDFGGVDCSGTSPPSPYTLTCSLGTPGSECTQLDYIQRMVCTVNTKPTLIPVDGATGPVNLEGLVKYFHDDAMTLGHGEECNIHEQNRLFTFTEEERSNLVLRIKNLNTMKTAGSKFCKLQEFQACYVGILSDICQCIKPTAYVQSECRVPNPDADCQHFSSEIPTKIDTGFENTVPGIQEILHVKLSKIPHTCESDTLKTCYFRGLPGAQCECKDLNFTGPTCQTKFTSLVKRKGPIPYPSDVSDYERKEKLFQELNQKAVEFEKGFTEPQGSACDVTGSAVATQVVNLFVEMLNSSKTPEPKEFYEDLIESFPVATKNITGKKICQPQLICDPSSKTCVKTLSQVISSGSPKFNLSSFIIAVFFIMLI